MLSGKAQQALQPILGIDIKTKGSVNTVRSYEFTQPMRRKTQVHALARGGEHLPGIAAVVPQQFMPGDREIDGIALHTDNLSHPRRIRPQPPR